MKRALVTFLTLIAVAGAQALRTEEPLLVVNENFFSEGFTPAGQTARRGEIIMRALWGIHPTYQEDIEGPLALKGREAWPVKTNDSFMLYSGGNPRGRVTVIDVVPYQCNLYVARVKLDQAPALREMEFSIATNRPTRDVGSRRRALKSTESQRLLQVGTQLLARRGYPKMAVAVNESAAVRFTGTEGWSLVGTLTARGSKVQVVGLLIVSPQGKVTFSSLRKSTDLEDGKDLVSEHFADIFDVDGDGVVELITFLAGYENEAFTIYKRFGAAWKELASQEGGGC